MKDGLLILNAGSSSLKFALYASSDLKLHPRLLLRGQIAGIGINSRFKAWGGQGKTLPLQGYPDVSALVSHAQAIDLVLDWVQAQAADIHLLGVGHRVVHGGRGQKAPALVTRALLDELESLSILAPHHQPHNLAAIDAVALSYPDLSQVACFDTAFHAHQPEVARRLPLPRRYHEQGILRYGFHGLSYEYIVGAVPRYNSGKLPPRLIVAHLGNGASLCAIQDGIGKATTMGFSTLDGVMMGTRCGSIDPGVLLYLMRQEGLGEEQLGQLVYDQCGLLGVSGISSDMQELLASSDPRAAEAVELYCYSLIQSLGSLIALLGGVDALVFTGGIGEHAAEVRARVCRQLDWLGMVLDDSANAVGQPLITHSASSIKAWVIPTDEELVIATHTDRLLHAIAASDAPDPSS